MKSINRYLDHAVLKPDLTQEEAKDAILLGIKYDVKTVCVRPYDIPLAIDLCKNTNTEVCVVLGFPHGCISTESKINEAKVYADLNVEEVDMVANYGLIRSEKWDLVLADIKGVVDVLKPKGILLKVIFETGVLDNAAQISKMTEICIEAGADFVKTSTGFNGGGASVEAVQTMLDSAGGKIEVKPSGGIRDLESAQKFIEMGATRLGVGYTTTPVLCENLSSVDDSDY